MKHKNQHKRRWAKVKSWGVTILLFFTLAITTALAQETVSVTGGDASGSGGSVSYTLGQVAYETHNGTGAYSIEGVQQPYEISVVTAIGELDGITLSISAYPNPVTDNLTLGIDGVEGKELSYQLYNLDGRILRNEKITDPKTNIAMSGFVSATYFVKVVSGSKKVKTFKIIKK